MRQQNKKKSAKIMISVTKIQQLLMVQMAMNKKLKETGPMKDLMMT